ncbi:hypothetical protein JS530_03130 [Bifidobacterium sp. LC6]|uniref:Uncharacterized protein n=1 Tax=Bifidobacterium colobi TaxID=2809026 RepID=A0ABS5UUZ6_9BIFI|nr:hypothetical protein [Bifidobacterium colobi]MBT1174511.1 hypothetical protein [Bifidobacterium colobi]
MAAKLKIIDQAVQGLKKGFEDIHGKLDLAGRDDMRATRGNVGSQKLIDALDKFNGQVSSTKNKYKIKTEKLIDFLKDVKTGSDDADAQIQSALKVK